MRRTAACVILTTMLLLAGRAASGTPGEPAGAAASAPTCANPVGEWKNQMGSVLAITAYDSKTGAICGSYQTSTGAAAKPFPLVGWVNEAPAPKGDHVRVLSFTVNWGEYGSITSWTGFCRADCKEPTLEMMWHLARSNSDFDWDHMLTGKDIFHPR